MHRRYLTLPRRNHVSSQASKFFVVAVFELRGRYVDGALLVSRHPGDEIAIDVSRCFSRHAQVHFADGQIALD